MWQTLSSLSFTSDLMICGLEVSNCSSFYQKGVIEFLATIILATPLGLGLGSLILLMVQKIPFPTTWDGHQTLVNNGSLSTCPSTGDLT